MLMPYTKEKVINLALSQVGYYEKASNANLDSFTANRGSNNWTKYARDLDNLGDFYNGQKNGHAWCDVFVDWCFVTAYGRVAAQELLCQPNDSCGAGCEYSAKYYANKGQFFYRGQKTPQPGDQIFFGSASNVSHTGLVVSVDSTHVYTVEGNSADQVAKRTYSLYDTYIYGYGRPNYGIQVIEPTDDAPGVVVVIDLPEDPLKTKWCNPKIPVIQNGSENGYVKAAQLLLIERGFYCGGPVNNHLEESPDGEFGPQTEASVKEFQRKAKLTEDGIVGANTWAALLNL